MLLFCIAKALLLIKQLTRYGVFTLLLLVSSSIAIAQASNTEKGGKYEESSKKKLKRASQKIESGFEKDNKDTLASGYFDLGETYYEKGDLPKSETYYQKSKQLYEKAADPEGIARSSRALAKVQEDLHKNKEAIVNYNTAQENNVITGDMTTNALNKNDRGRLQNSDSVVLQQKLLRDNLSLLLIKKDTNEMVSNLSRMGDLSYKSNQSRAALNSYSTAYQLSQNIPSQAMFYNQRITDVYMSTRNFDSAIQTKKNLLKQPFVQNSTEIKAKEITSLADIYIRKREDSTAIRLLTEAYQLSVKNGHTLEARKSIERLDSIFQVNGKKDQSLKLYKDFLMQLPDVISKDSSLTDERIIAETESRIRQLESEKALKDDLIKRKNIFNYWLIGSVVTLSILSGFVLFTLKKLRIRNKKIALQSLRREMNPHFIFNSLNSINQFIANNNELEANRYLTRFSTLMRRVMENSKNDFVLFSRETELLQNYLELEKSRFPDKFDYAIHIDDELYAGEGLCVPGMLIQPHIENSIWHGLRYMDEKGFLQLSFTKTDKGMEVLIEDNGIGIAASKKSKTVNQQKHSGRGITNTLERISILNELYHQEIICTVEDKQSPDRGVRVRITVPLLKNIVHED
jgi:tetratricopeptide (TPR) repeat protein